MAYNLVEIMITREDIELGFRRPIDKGREEEFGKAIRETPDEKNPFLNPLILNAMFKQCRVSDLANCRLVSKAWFSISLDIWRKKRVLVLKRKLGWLPIARENTDLLISRRSETDVYAELPELLQQLSAENNAEDILKLASRPFVRYKVIGGFSTTTEGVFWRTCGSWIKELHLHSMDQINVACWKKIVFDLTPNLQKLILEKKTPSAKDIKYHVFRRFNVSAARITQPKPKPIIRPQNNLKVLELRDQNWFMNFPVSWQEFFMCFPKIEEFYLPLDNASVCPNQRNNEGPFKEFISAIEHVKSLDRNNLVIKRVNGLMKINHMYYAPVKQLLHSTMMAFSKFKFPMTVLKMDIGYSTGEADVLRLIKSYADTLKVLVIVKGDETPASTVEHFPFMQTMKSLQMLEFMGQVVPNTGFLRYTPKLEKLCFTRIPSSLLWGQGNRYTLESSYIALQFIDGAKTVNEKYTVKLPSMREFHAFFKLLEPSSVKLLGEWMPKLEVLRSPVSIDTVPEVSKAWKNILRELSLCCDGLMDERNEEVSRALEELLNDNILLF